jgi:hypothetical protein
MVDFLLFINREKAIALAAQHKVPAIFPWRDVVSAGGLLSYGPDLEDICPPRGTLRRLGLARRKTRRPSSAGSNKI